MGGDGANPSGSLPTHPQTWASLGWQHPAGHRWRVSVQRGSGEWGSHSPQTRVWLVYRWRHRFKMPALHGVSRASLAGRVVVNTDTGTRGVAGVVVKVGDQSTRTDARGAYRFQAIEAGRHRVVLERTSVDVAWLAAQGWSQAITAEPGHAHALDWSLVEAAQLQGRLAWPTTSPSPPPFDGSRVVLAFECIDCPPNTPPRVVSADSAGGVEINRLRPGVWRGRVVSGRLPRHHHWPASIRVRVESGSRAARVWSIAYRPPSIQWAPTVPIDGVGGG